MMQETYACKGSFLQYLIDFRAPGLVSAGLGNVLGSRDMNFAFAAGTRKKAKKQTP